MRVLLRRLTTVFSSNQPYSSNRYIKKIIMSPKTIKDFGYAFNSEGQLRKLEGGKITDQPFTFNVSENHQECQQRYEELGEAITEHVYKLLDEEKLIRLPVPDDATPGTGTFIFVSKNYDKRDKLVVLIHGSGVVRAGQWARSLIINDSIHTGTQIPYIRKAISNNYGVLIMNTNDNEIKGKEIEDSRNPEEHALYVWEQYISKTAATSIGIVAHSYGGVLALALANKMKEDFEKRVKAVALTDSVHGYSIHKVTEYLKQVSRNWVASSEPLDSPVKTPEHDITRVSAGHQKHEMTSASCIDSVFEYIIGSFK